MIKSNESARPTDLSDVSGHNTHILHVLVSDEQQPVTEATSTRARGVMRSNPMENQDLLYRQNDPEESGVNTIVAETLAILTKAQYQYH